jgi:glycosyltransferase involved in cell wall biosynthesis
MSKPNTGPHITVLLATYNGSRYLPAQLDSLARQTVRPDRIVVRDDGSSDNSLVLVQEWAQLHGVACQPVTGPNLGPARCFLTATALAEDSDIFFFCDQDDVWLEDKIERAVDWLNRSGSGKPSLYASRLEVVDQDLQSLRKSESPMHLSFASAICESLLTGCTMAFNNEFRGLLCGSIPETVLMHDWWCYLLASGVDGATLYYDDRPSILYRQHSSNAVGAGVTGLRALKTRLQNFVGKNKSLRFKQLQEFSELYHDKLTASAARAIAELIAARTSPWRRIRVAFRLPIERQNFSSVLTTRLSILTNRY